MSLIEAAPVEAMAASTSRLISDSLSGAGRYAVMISSLAVFLRNQIVAAGLLELGDRFAPLLDHPVEHGDDLRIIQLDTLVDFTLLDGGQNQPDGGQARLVPCPHGILHILLDAVLDGHAQKGSGQYRRTRRASSRDTFFWLRFTAAAMLALAFLCRLFVELAATHFGQHAGLFTGAFETAQRDFKGLVFLYTYIGHTTPVDRWLTGLRILYTSRPKGKISLCNKNRQLPYGHASFWA